VQDQRVGPRSGRMNRAGTRFLPHFGIFTPPPPTGLTLACPICA
jgi:hypothetical protein